MAGSVSILGVGVVLLGTVRAGNLRPGTWARIERAQGPPPPPQWVEITKITATLVTQVPNYPTQYGEPLPSAGPGVQLAVVIRGVEKDAIQVGDVLRQLPAGGPAQPPPPPAPTGIPLAPLGGPAEGLPGAPIQVEVAKAFSIPGRGVLVVGTVRSGILRIGAKLRIRRASGLPASASWVEVTDIVPNLPTRVELYRSQYAKSLNEVGPGIQLAIGVRGVSKDDLKAGDLLVS